MVDADGTPSQSETTPSYECHASGHLNQEIAPEVPTEVPPQPTDSANRPYGTIQFREMLEMYLATWSEGKTRTQTLARLRALCGNAIQTDIRTMFATHAVYFFDETTPPTNPRESDGMWIQSGIMQSGIVPVDLTKL